MRIGFDLDGVIAIPTRKRSLFKMHEFYRTCILQTSDIPLPEGVHTVYIITGRKECFRNITIQWLRDCDFHYEGIFFFREKEKTFDNLAAHKIEVIRRLGIEVFFEDTPSIAEKIRREVPSCRIEVVTRKQWKRHNKA